jgi:polyisoprenoid-binding protein YceI
MTISPTTTTLPLDAGGWHVDTAHSGVEFTIRHLGLSKVRGRFTDFTATLHVGDSLPTTSLEATIELASVDTSNADRDAHLRSTDFFGVETNPQMVFRSTSIIEGSDGYVLAGELTLNGISNPVTLDVEFNGVEVYPMDQKRHAGFSATGTISRREYGIDFEVPLGVDKVALGDKVKVELEIQVVEPS